MSSILLKIKYPKFLLFLLTILIAYILFSNKDYLPFYNLLLSLGYAGIFLAGIFFAYSFTAAPATAILLISAKESNLLLAGFIAGFGALVGDLLIFNFIKHSFKDEIKKMSKEKIFIYINNKTPKLVKKIFYSYFSGFCNSISFAR